MATILIVDDHPINRELITTLLAYAGHRLLEAASGEEGLALARAERPDLIVTDIVMPAMDGYEFARLVRADPNLNQTQVVFYTASYDIVETRRLADACGVAHIIGKPAEPEQILLTVDLALHATPAPSLPPASEAFHQEHMRLLTDKLAAKVEELEAEIGARRRVEQALRTSEAELRALFGAMQDVILVLDADGRYLKIAPTTPPLLYRPLPSMLGQRLHDFFAPAQADTFVRTIRQALADGQSLPVDYSYEIGGQTVWFEATISPMGPDSVFLVARDITNRKQAEEALRVSEARLRTLFESAPISIWEEDFSSVKTYLNGLPGDLESYLTAHPETLDACAKLVKVLDVNQATLDLMQAKDKAELLGGLAGRLTPESRPVFKQELLGIGQGRPRLHLDATIHTRHGQQRDVTLDLAVAPGFEQSYGRMLLSLVDVTERLAAQAQVQRQLDRLAALRAIDNAINASLDLGLTLRLVLEQVATQLRVDAAGVYLLDTNTHALRFASGRGFRTDVKRNARVRLGHDYAERAAREREALVVPDLSQPPSDLPRLAAFETEDFQAYAGVPLLAKGQVVGVLEVFQRSPLNLDEEWLDFLEALAGQAAIAIDNAALFDGLQLSNQNLSLAYEATLEGWSRALDLRDRETEGHSERVTAMTLRLAEHMGLEPAALVHIRRGALLHDIGKMGIPDGILLKPGPLNESEWTVMKQHPGFAYNLLSPIQYLREALDIPYCHHEKWDGSGYPRGLRGSAIPLAARLFAVVDVWDALRSDRAYRAGWPEAEVRAHIRAGAGTHFDPEVVAAFEGLLEEDA